MSFTFDLMRGRYCLLPDRDRLIEVVGHMPDLLLNIVNEHSRHERSEPDPVRTRRHSRLQHSAPNGLLNKWN